MIPQLARSAAGITALVLVLAACGGKSESTPQQQSSKISVVASTNVWGSVVQAVGGDAVDVKAILDDPAADPHSYQSSTTDAATLKNAKLAVYNGGGYDDFFASLVKENGQDVRQIVTFDLSGKKAGANEHVWYDMATVRKVADKIAEELGGVAPDRKDTFVANARAFDAKVEALEGKAADIGKTQPGAQVVVTEPVAFYLLETAGVKDVTPEQFSKAIEEETDPPATAVAETSDLVKSKRVGALVNNGQTETPVTKQLNDSAKSAGIPIVNVTETLPAGVTGYVDWMTKQVDALSGALKK
jgi:zinc/manganese transport system substrate-binding protein